jgi:thioredoxin reductase (NADPH)
MRTTPRARTESLAGGVERLPIVVFPDGTHLVAPSNIELAAKAGMQTQAARPFCDVIVIGGGPTGLANAVYGAYEGLRVVIVASHATGGQAGTSSMIENNLGFPSGVTGADLAHRATTQTSRFGAEVIAGQAVVGFRRKDPYRVVVLADGSELTAFCVVTTTGMSARKLVVPGLDALHGRGIYYGAAMSEAARYRGSDVCIVGGANSAGQGALFFSRQARRVHILVRAAGLAPVMSPYLIARIHATPNIEVVAGVDVESVEGDGSLAAVVVKHAKSGERRTIPSWAMFIFIGVKPHADAFAGVLELDDSGSILTGGDIPCEHGRERGWPLSRTP